MMNNKKIFPMISLILLSAAAIPFAFIVLWQLDVDSKTIAEQLGSTTRLAIPSVITLVVLIWFGAGLDYALSFISKKNLRLLASVLVYLFIPSICCVGMPALIIMAFSGVFQQGWSGDSGFEAALFMSLAFIPAAVGFLFIYLGAGVSFISRWLAGRFWREAETG
ncbi:MAG: hypothetical protein K8S20_07725 [Chloroflexi bacterium]|nr:hypothetical protein [Chloroflexota bacterium]